MTAGKRKHRALKVAGIVVAVAVALCAAGFAWYVGDFCHADERAQTALADEGAYAGDAVAVYERDGDYVFEPEMPRAGLVFYPGGKVEASAYAPLMQELAEQGVLCVLTPMPFNLAVLDVSAADGVRERFPTVGTWYIGGHSLGGSMAASYAAGHAGAFRGLVLLAAYSTENVGDGGLAVLSLYGSNDGVLNRRKYDENKGNLPADAREEVIEGGNHAQFGSYGEQAGDGVAGISAEEQQEAAARAIVDWMAAA